MPTPIKIALRMALQFLLLTVNYRFVAKGSYAGTILSDMAICWLGWTLTRNIAESENWQDRIGYTAGGAIGSALGLYLTGA